MNFFQNMTLWVKHYKKEGFIPSLMGIEWVLLTLVVIMGLAGGFAVGYWLSAVFEGNASMVIPYSLMVLGGTLGLIVAAWIISLGLEGPPTN